MAACCVSQARKQKEVNRRIEKQLRQEKYNYVRREIRILVLGTAGSGKNTLMNQMRLIHGTTYSNEERRSFIASVFQNVLRAMHAMIGAMQFLKITYKNPLNYENANLIRDIDYEKVTAYDPAEVAALKALWEDDGIRECFDRRREYELACSAKYYLDSLERIFAADYVPSTQDILQLLTATTGIIEYRFEQHRYIYRMFNVRGSRSSRCKWMHIFDNITCLIFMVALSDYDEVLDESYNENRLEESRSLFQTILMSPWFENSSIVLLLNKKDVFEQKIMHSNLSDYFPQYDGPMKDAAAAREFILRMFLDVNPDPDKLIYFHYTNATDRENIQFVFETIFNIPYNIAFNPL